MKEFYFQNISKLVLSLLLLASSNKIIFAQTSISGVINDYGSVISLGPDYVILQDEIQISYFNDGDTVLLIQMKGGISVIDEGSTFGLAHDTIGSPGKYEFLIVNNVISASRRVNFRNDMINSFDVKGMLQLIKVPSYADAFVSSDITCTPWDSTNGTGGVVAMIVEGALTLNADIDVSGKGYKGGSAVQGNGICVMTSSQRYDKFGFHLDSMNSGMKGESQISRGILNLTDEGSIFPYYAKGKGGMFTGGGGGNGRFSGGGGGSNYGAGGKGGREMNTCSPYPVDGGIGGRQIRNSNMDGAVFPGGGGGSSTYIPGSDASSGGNGGGIVIILCDTLIGNGYSISANGFTSSGAGSNAGAGGGGGGGSVALYLRSFSVYQAPVSSLAISADGGNGGNNQGAFGEGGGGGGGLIWLKNTSLPANVTGSVSGGSPGTRTGASTALAGSAGLIDDFEPVLTGFLFNSIRSFVSGNQVDSICSNDVPKRLSGTNPVGGVAPYNYRWEKSYDQVTWIELYSGPDSINYTPVDLEDDSVYFRRIVSDSNIPALTDIGKPVRIIVHPYIKNNVIGDPDTLCYGQNPSVLNSIMPVIDGNGIYYYTWESSNDNSNYTVVSSGSESYLPPPALTQTTWYRRRVTSARCVDVSEPIRINVLENITNNTILTPSQEICEGMLFNDLTGTVAPELSGGDNTFRFIWQQSIDHENWTSAEGINNLSGYNPDENTPPFSGQEYFRRMVFSGSDNVCESTSNEVLLIKYPVITNNEIISGDQNICSGSVPLQLTGSVPLDGKGPGSYLYTWQDSSNTHSWTDIPGYVNVSELHYSPPALTDSTKYRRIVTSSACSDISDPVMINVHKPVSGNEISLIEGELTDTTICSGAVPDRIVGQVPYGGTDIPGDYIYQWLLSTDNENWTDITESANGRDYLPPALFTTTFFRRQVISGECSGESNTVRIQVLPLIANNTISCDPVVCKNDIPSPVMQSAGSTLSGGTGSYSFFWEESEDGLSWIPAYGVNDSETGSYQPPALTVPVKYRRIVTSGLKDCCSSISNVVDIAIDSLPAGTTVDAGNDTTIYTFDYTIRMTADPVFEGGTGKWTVIEGNGVFDNDSDNLTRVNNLSKGNNKFLWTVSKGACKLEDIIDVYVNDGLFIPEGFSPNNDPGNYNNAFVIKGLSFDDHIAELIIINGAGVEIFSASNRNGNEWSDWDGRNDKGVDLPEGTYYYLLKVTSVITGQVFKKSGFVILKRY